MSKLSRTKGHSFERNVAIALRHLFPDCRRHLEYHAREANGVDLIETGPYRFQCKKKKKYASVSTIKEIQCNRETEIPVVVTAGDNEEWMAILPFSELVKLIGKSNAL